MYVAPDAPGQIDPPGIYSRPAVLGRAIPSAPFTTFITAIQAFPTNSITKSHVQSGFT